MPHRSMAPIVGLVTTLLFSSIVIAQAAQSPQPRAAPQAAKDQKAAPVPRRDLSGLWDAGRKGILPSSGTKKPPMTPWGQEMAKLNKPGFGPREVPVGSTNDPLDGCDPAGFPRNDLFELRIVQIAQTPTQVLLLYQFQRLWRAIWADGRELPKKPTPSWYGYSVGKWEDDYTFVVQTVGTDERTWLDDEGNPHSADLRVEERFHRVDHDTLELTVMIDDPKTYTKPWVGVDHIQMKLQPPNTDVAEMMCAPSEVEAYKKAIADPAAEPGK